MCSSDLLAATDTPTVALFWSPDDPAGIPARRSLDELASLPGNTLDIFAVDVTEHPEVTDFFPVPDIPTVILHRGIVQKGIHQGPVSIVDLGELVARAFPDLEERSRRRRRPRADSEGRPRGVSSSLPVGSHVLPTPRQMRDHLDRFIRGQARAKRDVATAIYNHYLAQADRDAHGGEPRTHHILLLGPTGCGKTFIVRTLADLLGVPVAVASATGLVEAGYRGRSPDSIVKSLLDRAGGDPRLAEKGIVFIDEIDKIRCQDCGGSRDVSEIGRAHV